MNSFWLVLSCVISLIKNFLLFKYITTLLIRPKNNIIFSIVFSIVNVSTYFYLYFLNFPLYSLFVVCFLLYTFEVIFISNFNFRQSFYIVSSIMLNITAILILILKTFAYLYELQLLAIYTNVPLFLQLIFFAKLLLIVFLLGLKKLLPTPKLIEISTSKIYSEITTTTSLTLFAFLVFDCWFLTNSIDYSEFYFSTLATVIFSLLMYYCLFFFNINLIELHPYKRKADEIKSLLGDVIEKKIKTESKLFTDDLTKLYNRRFIYNKIDELCEKANTNYGIIYADLVGLKYVNDTYGHTEGDRYIISVSNILKSTIREYDFSARIGGDEFLIILIDVDNEIVEHVIDRIKTLIAIKNLSETYTIHANLGYRCYKCDEKKSRSEILEEVDSLMNYDKKTFYTNGGAEI